MNATTVIIIFKDCKGDLWAKVSISKFVMDISERFSPILQLWSEFLKRCHLFLWSESLNRWHSFYEANSGTIVTVFMKESLSRCNRFYEGNSWTSVTVPKTAKCFYGCWRLAVCLWEATGITLASPIDIIRVNTPSPLLFTWDLLH